MTSEKSITVKEMDEDVQPREKAERLGVGALSISELWALVLRTGSPGYPVTTLCRDLMIANSKKLHELERRSRGELLRFRGVGLTKAVQIEAVMELIRRYNREVPSVAYIIRSSDDIFNLMSPYISNLDHEEIWALFLNRRNQVIRRFKVSSGGMTSTVFDVKILMKAAILEGTEAMVICHNHPSGNLNPSASDDNMTKRCKEACLAMDIRLLDHVILSVEGHYSYLDNGRL